ncbi:MAG: serine protease AprX [Acidobacteriota bacterium]|jgi:subtilisin family serine protease
MARRHLLFIVVFAATAVPAIAAGHGGDRKLDAALRVRAREGQGTSRVIVETTDGSPADRLIAAVAGTPGRRLPLMRGQVAEVPDAALEALADDPHIAALSLDRPVAGTMERTGATTGATWTRAHLGVDGSGIGVALIDSGVTSWHDDLGSDRVVHFVDFVDFQPLAYDDYGHGTHVAGIIAGSGYDSNGARTGMAPGASLVVLKVLDGDGNGYISNVIAALDYAVQNRARFNIRVINLSVAAGVYASYDTDPLTLAARRAVEAGIVVVTAAGNFGRDAKGQPQYGGITSPGNAPWVLTVGASTHKGTISRKDDEIAPFSSRGPSYIDYAAKPDLVAPGVGIESLADGSSLLFTTHPQARLWGTVNTVTQPYLSLSGTSMSAPVVAGTVALMLQANPALTPNLVKAILQYTAEHRSGYDDLTQGAGFLNARGAVQLAKSFAADPNAPAVAKDPTPWNAHINWGNHRIGGGVLNPDANAWRTDVMWGASTTTAGDHITWGTVCGSDCDSIIRGSVAGMGTVWGTSCAGTSCGDVVWSTTAGSDASEIVWDRSRR